MARPTKPRGLGILGALRVTNPAEWERQIREALNVADGRVPEAAQILNVSTRQLYRWLGSDPRLADINNIRARRSGSTS